MHKKYLVTAALAALLGLSACSGKPADKQAAEDAQKINLEAMIPQMAADLTEECSRSGIAVSCPAEKAQSFIKSFPAFRGVIAQYDKKCSENYSASMCAQGYSNYLADDVANKLVKPVAEKATEALKVREAELARRAEEEAKAKAAAEEAARQAKAEADAAAQKAADEAKAVEEQAKAAAEANHGGEKAPEHKAPAAAQEPASAAPASE